MYYPEWYAKISGPFRSEIGVEAINLADKALVAVIAVAYVVAVVLAVAAGQPLVVLRVLVVPALMFFLVSYLRIRWDSPRPYELYDIDPIIAKDTRGKSMPSRHVASAVIIACALAWMHLDWGALAFAGCAIVCFTRIVGGVHFPRDVAAAVAIAVAFGIAGFVLVP